MSTEAWGNIHSVQTLGAVDGPGVRFVVFTQGCPLRCACCHNPDTWEMDGGERVSAQDLANRATRYREYFGADGGVTVSGGEPLMQPEFVMAFFKACREQGVHTCLDTSGCALDDRVRALLEYTDLVLLDIKYTDADLYSRYVGCELQAPLSFLQYLQSVDKPTWLRQVIIPTLNDTDENICRLSELEQKYPCVVKTELLPFRKLCSVKYDKLGMPFPLADIPQPTANCMAHFNQLLNGKRHP